MATLRDDFFIRPEASKVSQKFKDDLEVSGMGSIQRGWETGRVGNELNPLYTEELDAQIAKDEPRRSALRDQINVLKQKQGMYAPKVSDLRQINGIGDAAGWFGGQVGQGAASMVDPVAVSAGLSTAGRVASALPGPGKLIGGAAQLAALGVPALMSKRQLTGEFIGEAEQDPELMARTPKQGLRDMAGNYGTVAAIPDSFLPGMLGRQVSGLSRAGGAVARKAAFGPGLTTVGNMGVEGLTEGAQAAGSQYARGILNPNRDTSGDNWDIINNAAGGFAGAGPLSAAGAYSEAGHNRLGAGVDAVRGAVGDVVDMANTNPTVQAGVVKAKSIAERLRGSTVDIMSDDDGKISAAALVENLKAGAQALQSKGQTALEEHNVLNEIPPEGVELTPEWLVENDPKRAQLVADKLNSMSGDAEAQKRLDAILGARGDEAQHAAINDGAQFLTSQSPLGRAEERMNSLGENLGKIAGVVAPAIGRGAVAAGKAALGFGKAVLDGAKDGMRKKNEQTNEAPASPLSEDYVSWLARVYTRGAESAAARSERAAARTDGFSQRAELAGSYAEDMAKRGPSKNKNAGVFAKHVAFSIADMIDTDLSKGGVEAKAIKLDRLTTDFIDIYGKNAGEVISQLGSILGDGASPVVAHMMEQLQLQQSAQGRTALVTERDMLAKQVVSLVDPAMQNKLMKQGVNLNTPGGRDQVLRIMEDFADKINGRGARKALDETLGAESVSSILELLDGRPDREAEVLIDDRKQTSVGSNGEADGDDEELSDFDQRAAEKNVVKGSGPKVFGFLKAPNLRTHSERRDMFGAMDKPDSDGAAQRPQLFEKGTKLSGGRDAIEKKIEDVKAQLAGDPEYPDHDNYDVTAKSAYEVMKEAGMQPGKILQLYRDYMRMAAKDEELSEGERKYATQQARIAHGTILDAIQKKDADGKLQSYTFKTGPKDRAEIKQAAEAYFKERFLVVGEQLSNRDPSQITLPEILDMHKEGQGLIERSRLTDDPKATLSDANVLMFKSGAAKGGEVAIPAGKLVNWVRKMRGSTEQSSSEDNDESFSNKSKDDEYRNDVMEGIASLIGSGHVKGMPYKLNKVGWVERFADGIPDSLRLATKTEGEGKFADAKRRENQTPKSASELAPDEEAVAKDQNRNAEFFSPEDRLDRELVADERSPAQAGERSGLSEHLRLVEARYEELKTKLGLDTSKWARNALLAARKAVAEAREAQGKVLDKTGRAGTQFAEKPAATDQSVRFRHKNSDGAPVASITTPRGDRSGTTTPDPKFDGDFAGPEWNPKSTPLDFQGKQSPGEVPDEFANQRWLSRQTNAEVKNDKSIGPEPKGTAANEKTAKYRAATIGAVFVRDANAGMDMIKMRIRMAMRPGYAEDKPKDGKLTVPGVAGKDQVVGGVHYIAPVAAFINSAELAKANVDMPAKTITAIRAKVANILLKGEVSLPEKVKIARLMLDGEEKVTAMNVDALLTRIGNEVPVGKPVVAKQEAAAPVEPVASRSFAEREAERIADLDRLIAMNDKLGEQLKVKQFPLTPAAATLAERASALYREAIDQVRGPKASNDSYETAPKKSGVVKSFGPTAPKRDLLTTAIAKRQEYLDNPPADYTSEQAKSIAEWAKGQLARVLAEKSNDIDRQDQLSDYKVGLMTLMKKAASVLEGDASLKDFEGTPAPEVAKAGLPKGQQTLSGGSEGRKLNAMAVDIHRSLGRDGFAATHDSPIRHEGKFDWRSHIGKGEGNAAFGAGTYLSTGEGVHKSYKGAFTAQLGGDAKFKGLIGQTGLAAIRESLAHGQSPEVAINSALRVLDARAGEASAEGILSRKAAEDIRKDRGSYLKAVTEISPTYEVSVDIKPEQLLDWNKPLSEQSALVQKALKVRTDGEVLEFDYDDGQHAAYTEDGGEYTITRDGGGLALYKDGDYQGHYGYLDEAIGAARVLANDPSITGKDLYNSLTDGMGSQAAASNHLQSLGILGHKYAASGGKNDTHPNYVVYDDSRITTNYVHFNNQDAREGNSKVSTQAERDAAVAEAKKLFGDQVKVDFQAITGYSGEFIDATNVIVISTTAAAGTMNTLFHEAMHKFFKDFVKSNPKLQAVFESLINDPKHLQKLHDLLDGYPAAQAQLTSGEERLAYTYQFWKAGLLQVDTKAHTWLQKVGKFFRHVLGRVRDSERALELFQAFDNGKMSEPSAAGMVIAKALNRGTTTLKVRQQMDGLIQGLAALTVPAAEILGNSLSPTARKLSPMLFTNPGEETHGTEVKGLMNARQSVARQYTNVSNRRFETMNEVDKNAVQKYLQSGTDPATIPSKEQREAVKDIRHLLDRFHKYMTDAGMDIGKIDDYYPVVWNPHTLNAKRSEFINMLATKYAGKMGNGNPQKAAERIWQSLVNKEGVDAHLPVGREDGVLSPFFASQEQRTLPWLEAADREKYLDKDMPLTLTRYFSQGAHATEYFRRFGKNGIRLEKMLSQINSELSGVAKEMMKRGEIKDEKARVKWVGRQMRDVSQSVGAMEGTLGKDVSPNMRKFNSWMTVYQNIRLLPMALFSSFVDPLALVARGAPLQAAYETFIYGMREVFRNWADAFKDMPPERAKDEWRQLAEHIGASEIAMFSNLVSDQYSSTYMTPGAKKLNDKMFVFNGMEAWNRGSRIMATKWAVRFIEKHVGLPDAVHSARWLKELGLTPAMITMDDGKLVTNPQQLMVLKGITLDEARAQIAPIHDALNRWVEGAVLTPNAAQRPAWSSDPNYASAFHLKQFSYSFHQTILKRATNEFSHGNMAPLGALAMFVPTMIGADLMKGLIQGGGSLPPYMASMNAGDWVMHGAQRAGLSGIGVIGMDAATDWASLGGPAFEQIIDAARDGFGSKSALNAMPLHSLYGQLATA